MTAAAAGERLGISRITARRYLEHLVTVGSAASVHIMGRSADRSCTTAGWPRGADRPGEHRKASAFRSVSRPDDLPGDVKESAGGTGFPYRPPGSRLEVPTKRVLWGTYRSQGGNGLLRWARAPHPALQRPRRAPSPRGTGDGSRPCRLRARRPVRTPDQRRDRRRLGARHRDPGGTRADRPRRRPVVRARGVAGRRRHPARAPDDPGPDRGRAGPAAGDDRRLVPADGGVGALAGQRETVGGAVPGAGSDGGPVPDGDGPRRGAGGVVEQRGHHALAGVRPAGGQDRAARPGADPGRAGAAARPTTRP